MWNENFYISHAPTLLFFLRRIFSIKGTGLVSNNSKFVTYSCEPHKKNAPNPFVADYK